MGEAKASSCQSPRLNSRTAIWTGAAAFLSALESAAVSLSPHAGGFAPLSYTTSPDTTSRIYVDLNRRIVPLRSRSAISVSVMPISRRIAAVC